jgi:hypothetical protein
LTDCDDLWAKLQAYADSEVGPFLFGKKPVLTPSTRVLEDLRLDGTDAYEFLESAFDKFNIKNVENFPFHRYFGGDGVGSIFGFFAVVPRFFWFLLTRKRPEPEHPFTLGMLLLAMHRERWDTAPIEREAELRWPRSK